jgi:amino acid adenylation domain-containing protein
MSATATPVPLTSDQQRLWFAHLAQSAGAALNVPVALRMRARFREDALRAAVRCVERRHDALRLRITDEGGIPWAEIRDGHATRVSVRRVESGLDSAAVLLEARRFAALAFDPAVDPLLRVAALVRTPDDWLLVVVMHHLICDAASANVVAADLCAAFGMAARGEAPRLPPVAKPYRTLLAEREAAAAAGRSAGHLEFWRRELARTDLQWSVADPRVSAPSAALAPAGDVPECRVTFDLPEPLTDRIAAFARAAKASPFMVFLAAYAALLRRWSRMEDAAILIPVSQRKGPEDHEVVGLWANTVPIRCAIGARTTYRQLVGQLRGRVLEAIRHDVPFGDIVTACAPSRDPLGLPISRAMFTLQADTQLGPGVPAVPVDVETGSTQAELTLFVWTGAAGPRCAFEFDQRIGAANARRMARCYSTLLGALGEQPDTPIDTLRLLDPELRRAALETGNDTAFRYPAEVRIERLFAQTAAAHRERIALVDGALELSYGELDAAAESLCAALRPAVAAADRVVIALERSAAWVVAALAVLKCGGTYVPLDGALPEERVRSVLAEVAPVAAIVPAAGAERFQSHAPFRLAVDEAGSVVTASGEAAGRRRDPVSPGGRDVAYVCYTSGSSGRPKGIEIEHRSVVRLVRDTNYIRIEPFDRVAHASAVAFDAVTFEVWGALLNGAALVVVGRETMLAPDELAAFVRERGLTVAFVTTALFNAVARVKPEAFRSLRVLLFGGERADPSAVAAVASAGAKPERLLHVYGPTEVTTFSLWHEISDARAAGPVPIGLPVGNTTAYVLDEALEPLPPNVVGELYLGGQGLARGYLGRAALTAQRFVPDPFAAGGERMYRTGDLAYRDEAGRLIFAGRADRQIKLRGFRIEPAEVEQALRSLAGVSDALVVHVPESAAAEASLSAYLIREPGGVPLDPRGWRELLRASLPEYMIPASYAEVPAFPLTLNGKVDHARLPAAAGVPRPAPATSEAGHAYEAAVAEAFREAFGTQPIGLDDDFFELGGHSLIALRVAAAATRATGRTLGVRTIFELRTPRAIGAALVEAHGPGSRDRAPAGADGDADEPAPLTPTQEQMVLLEAAHPDGRQNVPLVFRLREPLDPSALEEAWNGLVAAHDMMRVAIRFHDGTLTQRASAPPPKLSLRERAGAGFEAAFDDVRSFVRAPFDLASGPPARVALFPLEGSGVRVDDAILAIAVHHVAFDGASLDLLVAELFARYAEATGGARYVAPRPRQFLPYARETAQRDVTADLAYGKRILSGFPFERRLFGSSSTGAAEMRRIELGSLGARPGRVAASAPALGMTPYVLAAAALSCALQATHGVDDVLIGSPFSLRGSRELDSTIGPLVVSAPLRVRVSAPASVRAFLAAVRMAVADAHVHLGVPAERLLQEAGGPPGRSFDVWLAVHRAHPGGLPSQHVLPEELVLSGPAKYPVRIDWMLGERDSCDLSYDPGVVEAERASDLARAFAAALNGLASPESGTVAEVLAAVVRALRDGRHAARSNARLTEPHSILAARRRSAVAPLHTGDGT